MRRTPAMATFGPTFWDQGPVENTPARRVSFDAQFSE